MDLTTSCVMFAHDVPHNQAVSRTSEAKEAALQKTSQAWKIWGVSFHL